MSIGRGRVASATTASSGCAPEGAQDSRRVDLHRALGEVQLARDELVGSPLRSNRSTSSGRRQPADRAARRKPFWKSPACATGCRRPARTVRKPATAVRADRSSERSRSLGRQGTRMSRGRPGGATRIAKRRKLLRRRRKPSTPLCRACQAPARGRARQRRPASPGWRSRRLVDRAFPSGHHSRERIAHQGWSSAIRTSLQLGSRRRPRRAAAPGRGRETGAKRAAWMSQLRRARGRPGLISHAKPLAWSAPAAPVQRRPRRSAWDGSRRRLPPRRQSRRCRSCRTPRSWKIDDQHPHAFARTWAGEPDQVLGALRGDDVAAPRRAASHGGAHSGSSSMMPTPSPCSDPSWDSR